MNHANFYNQKKKSKGFTLVEIIVVLVVLAILAAILVPSMVKWIEKAEKKKLITACKACVTAAQTLIVEDYAKSGQYTTVPSASEVLSLADIGSGSVSNISITPPRKNITSIRGALNGSNIQLQVSTLTYTDDDGDFVTYVLEPSPHFNSEEPRTWVKGSTYYEGDIMVQTDSNGINPLIFRCIKEHKSGRRSNTRNPYVKSNKGTWEVIGTPDGKPAPYSSVVRYGIGVVAKYNGNLYARTGYNLTGGQTPYSKSSSTYWILLGPDPDAAASDAGSDPP